MKQVKNINATNGKKAHNDNQFIKVGRIRMNSWASKKMPVADIIISERELVHIANRHTAELKALGIDAFNYVCTIINQCNEIRKDKIGMYLFIVRGKNDTTKSTLSCAVVELVIGWLNHKRIYKIKTARPEKWGRLSKLELVCDKPRS